MSKKFITPSLMLSMLLSGFPIMLLSLYISDMAQYFEIQVGMIGVVRSVSESASVVMGLLLGGLSVRYRLKSLLTVGIALMCIASFTLNLISLFYGFILIYAVFGLSKVILRSMSNALVAQFFTVDERPKIVSYLIAGMAISYIFGSILAVFISDFRVVSLTALLPLSLIAFLLVSKGIPSVASSVKRNPLRAFRQVLGNQSIVMSLVGNALAYMGPNTSALTFFMPLFLQRFDADRSVLSMIFMAGFLLIIGGNVLGGRLVNRVGRKPLIILFQPLASVFCFAYIFAPTFELSALFWNAALLVFSLSMPAYNSLLLELAPEYRGTVMSLSETSQFIAQAIGSGVGGLILIGFGFDGLGWFSLSGIVAGMIFFFFVVDPTKTQQVKPTLREEQVRLEPLELEVK